MRTFINRLAFGFMISAAPAITACGGGGGSTDPNHNPGTAGQTSTTRSALNAVCDDWCAARLGQACPGDETMPPSDCKSSCLGDAPASSTCQDKWVTWKQCDLQTGDPTCGSHGFYMAYGDCSRQAAEAQSCQ